MIELKGCFSQVLKCERASRRFKVGRPLALVDTFPLYCEILIDHRFQLYQERGQEEAVGCEH